MRVVAQLSLLPERIHRIEPNPVDSADSPGIGVALSHQRYVLKRATAQHPHLQATEWACHALAFALHVPVPHWCVCELPDGTQCFGSRMEGAVLSNQVLPNAGILAANPEVFSHALVLDSMLGNEDRHPGNWLLTETGGARVLRPIDFSRALLFRWPPGGQSAWPPGSNSERYYTLAWQVAVCTARDAGVMVDRIHALPKAQWSSIVESIPALWLSLALRRELVNWWWSPIWINRIKWIESQL